MPSQDNVKDIIFHGVTTRALTRFSQYVLENEVLHVTDLAIRNQSAHGRLVMWKGKFMEILRDEQNQLCSLLLAENSGMSASSLRTAPSLPKEVCEKLQKRIKILIEEKHQIVLEHNKLVQYTEGLRKLIDERDRIILQLQEQLISKNEIIARAAVPRRDPPLLRIASPVATPLREEIPVADITVPDPDPDPDIELVKDEELTDDEFLDICDLVPDE